MKNYLSYFTQHNSMTNATERTEAIKTFVSRGWSDINIQELLTNNEYTIFKHKKTGEYYGECLQLVQTQYVAYGIFEFIPFEQLYVILNLETGNVVTVNKTEYFHDADIFLQLRPDDLTHGDWTLNNISLLETEDAVVLNLPELPLQ